MIATLGGSFEVGRRYEFVEKFSLKQLEMDESFNERSKNGQFRKQNHDQKKTLTKGVGDTPV